MIHRKTFVITPFIALCALAINALAQQAAKPAPTPSPSTIYLVNYMKSREGYVNNVHEIWKPFQKEVVRAGRLESWSVWEVRWAGKNSEYDYLTVDTYRNWAAMEKSPYTIELFAKAHPGKSAQEALKRTHEVRDHVRSDLLWVMAATEAPADAPPAKHVLVEFWHVPTEKIPEYEKLLLEVYYPWRQEGVRQGRFSFWQFYQVLGAGSESPYNYVTARGYDKWEDIGSVGGPEILAKVHPKMKGAELQSRTAPLRTLVKTHVLTLVDQVAPAPVRP